MQSVAHVWPSQGVLAHFMYLQEELYGRSSEQAGPVNRPSTVEIGWEIDVEVGFGVA